MHKHRVLLRLANPLFKRKDDNRKPEHFKSLRHLICVSLTQGDHGFDPIGKRIHSHWLLQIQLGRGAGYILGRTLFLARNMRDPKFKERNKRKPWMAGWSQNANEIPASDG